MQMVWTVVEAEDRPGLWRESQQNKVMAWLMEKKKMNDSHPFPNPKPTMRFLSEELGRREMHYEEGENEWVNG